MFEKKDKRTQLEKEIDRTLMSMSEIVDQTSEEYDAYLATLDKQTRIEERRKSLEPQKRSLDPNTVAGLLVSCVQMIGWMKWEDLKVITGKAVNWIHRPRI